MYESMFETFIKVAYQNDAKADDDRAMVDALKKLPAETLMKIANGEVKLAYAGGGESNLEWLEQFKGTPMFEQALQLEQQAINIEMMRQQTEAQRDAERKQGPDFYEMEDRIRLQKRLLGLQLASSQLGGAPGAGAPPPSAAPLDVAPPPPMEAAGGAPPPSVEGKVAAAEQHEKAPLAHRVGEAVGRHVDTLSGAAGALFGGAAGAIGAGGAGGGPLAQIGAGAAGAGLGYLAGRGSGRFNQGLISGASHAHPHAEAKTAEFIHAEAMGRKMASSDYERAVTTNLASESGELLAKVALNLGAIPKMLGTGGMVGAGLGAAAGAASGLQKDEHGQRHLGSALAGGLAGAAGGAVLGHAAQGVGGRMLNRGQSLGQAAGNYGTQVQRQGQVLMGAGKGAVSPTTAFGASEMRLPGSLNTPGASAARFDQAAAKALGPEEAKRISEGRARVRMRDEQGTAALPARPAPTPPPPNTRDQPTVVGGGARPAAAMAAPPSAVPSTNQATTAVNTAAPTKPSAQAPAPQPASAQPRSGVSPTISSSTPMGLSRPAPMGNRIPTGMVNGQQLGGSPPLAAPDVRQFSR